MVDTSGYIHVTRTIEPWSSDASLQEVSDAWRGIGFKIADQIEKSAADLPDEQAIEPLIKRAMLFNYEGKPAVTYQILEQLRSRVENDKELAREWLYTIIHCQGVAAIRRGEDENCIMCRGDSSCILPINPAAVHQNPEGSQLAIRHFTEYLEQFPNDHGVRWLLNLAHMTLGEYPNQVDPRFLIRLDHYDKSEFDIGKFRDVGHLAGVNRLNQAGGAIMEDFHNEGRLDIVITSADATEHMILYRSLGDGTFQDRTKEAGLLDQVGGGLNCVQTDYNNDGYMDIFVIRGSWIKYPVRPSLLRNNGNGTFTDVTDEAGLQRPMTSIAAQWADYDNDGFLDLFVCGQRQPSRLYRNKRDGTFEDVSNKCKLPTIRWSLGCAWLDFDNDRYPDLFVNVGSTPDQSSSETANLPPGRLYRNNRDGTFIDVTESMGANGPKTGFSCWAFDYDNDGWLDIYASCSDRTLKDVVHGMQGLPHDCQSNKLFHNLQGKGFQDVAKEVGLDMVFAAMGSNFGDFDNDGYLDMYLGTGAPDFEMLVPNRMFKNVAGRRFAEITASSRTGHLQKGHGVACGDWRRCGDNDIFIELGGATNGDKYHNVLFVNPGQGNNWLNLKLVGKETNCAAIGARIKVVTPGDNPLTVHRHVSSGSSFGANPLEQNIGLGKATKVALLEIFWPTSNTTQVFRDLDVNQGIRITEFGTDYEKRDWKTIPIPEGK